IKNGLEAMRDPGATDQKVLVLRAARRNGTVLVSVKDTGAGIPIKNIGRIFEPYYSTKGQRGTGIGLYLAQQIISAHGGSIEVRSEAGKGTEFIVNLPLYTDRGA